MKSIRRIQKILYVIFKIWNIILWKISNVVLTPRKDQYAVLEDIERLIRMTKVIKGEFEKIKDVKVEDVSLSCDTSLEIFNMEVSRLSGMDNDLFTYKFEVANIPCKSVMDDDLEDETDKDMGYDPSDVAFIEWLRSKKFNYKTMDPYTMKVLWIYWIRGDDEEYVAVKEDEYDDLIMTRRDACQAYQEIFRIMDEGWMVANAARNIEIFRDRPKNEGDNKRDRDDHRIRPSETPLDGSNLRADDRRDSDRHGNKDRYGIDR
ncbi:hypothetical protein Tco_0701205 [Tanacetum coccineum]